MRWNHLQARESIGPNNFQPELVAVSVNRYACKLQGLVPVERLAFDVAIWIPNLAHETGNLLAVSKIRFANVSWKKCLSDAVVGFLVNRSFNDADVSVKAAGKAAQAL